MLQDEYIRVELNLATNGKAFTTAYNVRFLRSNSGYGSDTYMELEPDNKESYSPCIDIRYDQDYDPGMSDGEHLRYVINYFMTRMYTGKNGSAEVNGIKAHIMVDL